MTSFALFVLAFCVRSLPWPVIFAGGSVTPYGFDAYYHLRRIAYSASHFPQVLSFDPYINYPEGAKLHWTPFFDWSIALLVRLFVGSDEGEAIERFVVWIPPLVGAATVVATYAISRRFLGRRAALFGGLFLALVPAHVNYSAIGFVDHHCAVALVSVGLLAIAMEYLDRSSGQRAQGRSSLNAALWLGLLVAVSLLLQPGMLLQVAILELGLLGHLLGLRDLSRVRETATRLCAAHLLALATLAPFAGGSWPRWGSFHPAVLSGFQPWLCGVLACFYAAARMLPAPALLRPVPRVLTLGVVGALLTLTGLWWEPGLTGSLGESAGLFLREGVRADVMESDPLLAPGGSYGLASAVVRLSGAIVLLPLLLAWGLRHARSTQRQASLRFLCWWALALLGATLAQGRFANSLAIPLAMIVGWAIDAWLLRQQARGWRDPAWVLGSLAITLSALPALHYYMPDLSNQIRALRGRPIQTYRAELRKRILVRTARWLRDHAEPEPGYLDASETPPFGVLSAWSFGDVLLYESQRAVVACNFGSDVGWKGYSRSVEFFRAAPARASAILEELRVRYVVSHKPMGSFEAASMLSRLHFLDAAESDQSVAFDGRQFRQLPQPSRALPHYRLLYESLPLPSTGWAASVSAFKIFERVPGARLEGGAAPGARVEARLVLRTNRGRWIHWRTHVGADEAGRYRLVLPYATGSGPWPVRALGSYRVRAEPGGWMDVVVPEQAVLGGASLAGPDLRP